MGRSRTRGFGADPRSPWRRLQRHRKIKGRFFMMNDGGAGFHEERFAPSEHKGNGRDQPRDREADAFDARPRLPNAHTGTRQAGSAPTTPPAQSLFKTSAEFISRLVPRAYVLCGVLQRQLCDALAELRRS